MKPGKSVTDYFSRIMAIVNQMRIHDDRTNDVVVVEKIPHSMTLKFSYVVYSNEEYNDIDELSLDELQSSLIVHEREEVEQ